MDESGLLISLLLAAFMFVLGWLVGIERNNKLTKDLEFWKAYARELDKEKAIDTLIEYYTQEEDYEKCAELVKLKNKK